QGTWTYQYDALGNRIAETQNGQETQYLIDPTGLGDVTGQFDGSGNVIAHYAQARGLTSRVDSKGLAGYYNFDLTGNTTRREGEGIRAVSSLVLLGQQLFRFTDQDRRFFPRACLVLLLRLAKDGFGLAHSTLAQKNQGLKRRLQQPVINAPRSGSGHRLPRFDIFFKAVSRHGQREQNVGIFGRTAISSLGLMECRSIR